MCVARQFIGQASKKSVGAGKKGSSNYSTGQDTAGMNQAQQQRVLQQFSDGIYNILVCTCVGEEGLDVSNLLLQINPLIIICHRHSLTLALLSIRSAMWI